MAEFKSDFTSLKRTIEEKLFSLVAIQQRLIDDHNAEGYECNRWYTYWRPRLQAVGKQIVELREQLSKDSPSLVSIIDKDGKETGEKEYSRQAEKEKAGFDTLKKAILLADFFTGENPTKSLPDPYENFNDYAETDPNWDIAIGNGSSTGSKLTMTSMVEGPAAHVVKDFGADHFDTFEHKLKFRATAQSSNPALAFWAVANNIAHFDGITEGLIGYWYGYGSGSEIQIYLESTDSGTDWCYGELNTYYYITIDREGDSCLLYIRTGSHTGSLIDTLSETPTSARKFRYAYGVASRKSSSDSSNGTFTVEDLDLTFTDLDLQETENAIFFGMNF